MTPSYCIQDIQDALQPLDLPNKEFLADFLVALITCQKARLTKIANAMPGEAKPESNLQRIRRFLDHPHVNLAPALVALLPKDPPWTIAIDRTNWKIGERDVNLLTLAVVVGKIAIPLLWQDLEHPGNSDTPQRIALMQEFLTLFGSQAVQLIIGDREFIGEDWLAWLDQQGLPFLVRLRKDDPLVHPNLGKGPAMQHFKRACRGKKRAWWAAPQKLYHRPH
jgi:Transposase DDE domain